MVSNLVLPLNLVVKEVTIRIKDDYFLCFCLHFTAPEEPSTYEDLPERTDEGPTAIALYDYQAGKKGKKNRTLFSRLLLVVVTFISAARATLTYLWL